MQKIDVLHLFCIFEVWILTQWSYACKTTGEFARPGGPLDVKGGRLVGEPHLLNRRPTQATAFEDDLILKPVTLNIHDGFTKAFITHDGFYDIE